MPQGNSLTAARVGGWSLITAAVGFMAVFSYLAATFNYPDVLDGRADVVLPQLLALGGTGRAVWFVYALLPLLLVPAGIGLHSRFHETAPNATRAAMVFGVLCAASMLVGLARWPTLHWALAEAYETASPDARLSIDAVFRGTNLYLGNFIGEFVGELCLNAFFVLAGVALLRAGQRLAGYGSVLAGAVGLIAAFRNVTPAVSLIAELDNYILPVWLIVLGVVMLRGHPAGAVGRNRETRA